MTNPMQVKKASGIIEEFSPEKIDKSLLSVGVEPYLIGEAKTYLLDRIKDGVSTKEIHHHLRRFLKSRSPSASTKYNLKRAVMELGPSGFPFESFISKIMECEGYSCEVGVELRGECVGHEIDVIASKGEGENAEKLMIECKFHNKPGIKTDSKVLLHTFARFSDVKEKHKFTKAVLATNTKVTLDALEYADCKNILIFSWDNPFGGTVPDLIEKHGLHPLTECTNLPKADLALILQSGIVLCRDFKECNIDRLQHLTGIHKPKLEKARIDVDNLLKNHSHN